VRPPGGTVSGSSQSPGSRTGGSAVPASPPGIGAGARAAPGRAFRTTGPRCGAFYNADVMPTSFDAAFPLLPRPALTFVPLVLLSFLVGGVPFSTWIGRHVARIDIRRHGSRNPGAANVWRTVGPGWGILVGALDAAKGAAMVVVAWWAAFPDERAVWVGAAAVIGHNFSPWLSFRGGKGGATTFGMLACFVLPELLVVFSIWLAGWLLFRGARFRWSMSAASITPMLVLATGRLDLLPFMEGHPPRPVAIVGATILLTALLWIRVLPGMRPAGGRAIR